MQSSSDSPVASPEDVTCYEECVVAAEEEESTEDVFTPPATVKSSTIPKAKKDSGRVTKKSRARSRSVKDRKCSSPLILKWLEQNYEMVPGACLPRSVLYTHYQDFCKRNLVEPSSAASFGKIIRMKFPNLSTRRLGTRGQSKYHYYGLAIKETSIYFRSVYSKQGLTRFSGAPLKRENSQFYNPASKTGALLPDFPKVNELHFSKPFPVEKVETFLLMYRAHSQRILDSVVRTNFHEVQDFLVHFWQGMPQHVLPILGCQATVDLVVICDFVLYNSLCEVLVPANLQQLPENLIEDTLSFSHNLVEWLFGALQDLPAPLGIRKVQGAEMFGKSLRRQIAMVQLAKDARGVLKGSESVTCILNDWRSIDFEAAASQVVFSNQFSDQTAELFKEFSGELEQLLVKQSSLEVYFEWLDSLVERKVCEPASKGLCSLQELSQDFTTTWNNFYLVVEKEVALLKGKSFELYRLIHLVLSEYIQHVMESLQAKVIESQYNNILRPPIKPSAKQKAVPPKLKTGSCSLPPIFPPTPTSANSDKEFIHYFENKLAHEFPDGLFFSSYSSLQSPTFATGMSDTLYDGFYNNELGDPLYDQRQSCLPPTSLPIDGVSPHGFDGTPTPLTPQSSLCSSSSPLSHVSVHSPRESMSMTPDMSENNRPISQVSMYNLDSPLSHVPPPPPAYGANVHSADSSTCTSPLQHVSATTSAPEMSGGLNIAASLDLVSGPSAACGAGGNSNVYTSGVSYGTPVGPMPLLPSSPPLSACYTHQHHMPPPPYVQMHSPVILAGHGYPMLQDMNRCPQYDYELHHFMSDPSELLTKSMCVMEDTKPSIRSLAQSPTAII